MSIETPDVIMIAGTTSAALLQQTIHDLISASVEVAFAVERVRLPALHVIADVLPSVQHFRITLARFDASSLDVRAPQIDEQRLGIERLLDFARSGRLQIRAAGSVRWDPDFSLFRMRDVELGTLCLFGAHYLAPPHRGIDWPLTCVLARPAPVQRAVVHFESLWAAAHDALGPVTETLERQLCG